jgi:hypothetical protein
MPGLQLAPEILAAFQVEPVAPAAQAGLILQPPVNLARESLAVAARVGDEDVRSRVHVPPILQRRRAGWCFG